MDSTREAFEKWCESCNFVTSRRFSSTSYASDATDRAWYAWQASRSAAIEECAAVVRKFNGEWSDDNSGCAAAILALKGEG